MLIFFTIGDYDKALALKPDYAECLSNRGAAKYQLDDLPGALVDFLKALELKPDFANAYLGLGLVKISSGDKESGCKDLNKAGELGLKEAYDLIKKVCK